jgi:ABC-type multidrug transport system ATPase subunit
MKITIRHLSKAYGSQRALNALSLDIAPGQVVALLGPNGAGKSTLLRCLAGVAAPDDGQILYDSELFRRDRLDLRRRFAFLPDRPFVYPEITALRHIAMVLRLYEADAPGVEDRVLALLRAFDLLAHAETPLKSLSRGQLYKAALVGLLAVNPEVWLLDEPFASGVDPRGLASFRAEAASAGRAGRTVLYSTQILEVAEHFADRVCILHRGQVHAFESVDHLRERACSAEPVLEELFQQLREVGR